MRCAPRSSRRGSRALEFRSHLAGLALFQRIWGCFGLLAAGSLGILALGTEAASGPAGSSRAYGVVLVLSGCAALLAAIGLGTLAVARGLLRCRTSARTAALLLAAVNLVLVPFGTALAIYTVWLLLNDDARRAFGRPLRGAVGSKAR